MLPIVILTSSVLLLVVFFPSSESHGRLIEPPSRSSAWRYGFNTPINYDDNQLFCGGFQRQWQQNQGRCGVCGDPYNGPQDNDAGGRYATGTIVRQYTTGQTLPVTIQLTANHMGWFEFRLCPVNTPTTRVTSSCLDRNLLTLADGSGTRIPIDTSMGLVSVLLQLPRGLSCSQCVLQWKYNTGNSWGVDAQTGEGCVGCGPQEQFYGCADIAILQKGSASAAPYSTRPPTRSPRVTTRGYRSTPSRPGNRIPRTSADRQTSTYSNRPPTRSPLVITRGCRSTPSRPGNGIAGMGGAARLRPEERDGSAALVNCRATGSWKGAISMDEWCQQNCSRGYCPPSYCVCG